MSRPKKRRTVCDLPRFSRFAPLDIPRGAEGAIIMTVDEYEVLRLIDGERLTQQETSEKMQVSRTTVQAIHDQASRKMAECLVNGRELIIEGGDYQTCTGSRRCRWKTSCPRNAKDRRMDGLSGTTSGGKEETMIIVVPTNKDGKTVDGMLARAAQFAVVENGTVRYVSNDAAHSQGGAGVKAAQQLIDLGANVVITRLCGVNAAEVLAAANVKLYQVKGDFLEENLAAYQEGTLERLSDVVPGFHGGSGK